MNNNPAWWDTTITIYNKFIKPNNKVEWYRTVITNCFWKYTGNKINIDQTILETNNIICRIPEDDRYVAKYIWNELTDKTGKFTIGVDDIIVKGGVTDEIDEYIAGMRSTDFLKKYKALQGCMTVQVMSDNTGSIRNNKHYYVSGI